jgi:hypothetical protein
MVGDFLTNSAGHPAFGVVRFPGFWRDSSHTTNEEIIFFVFVLFSGCTQFSFSYDEAKNESR